MTPPIDRAAKAIEEAMMKGRCGAPEATHAALATTREPTPEMITAGAKKVRGGSSRDCARAVWHAMHDAMMAEGKEPMAIGELIDELCNAKTPKPEISAQHLYEECGAFRRKP